MSDENEDHKPGIIDGYDAITSFFAVGMILLFGGVHGYAFIRHLFSPSGSYLIKRLIKLGIIGIGVIIVVSLIMLIWTIYYNKENKGREPKK